ncbi:MULTISPECIES: hypothetical protein [unclassified Ketobacter]|jgi:hypothetical protein|uniref:hypothetical protein n=1 Tax=unclassified Ketobacter TaxID=2639109 RepID=UPI000C5E4639|nr:MULTISPECIES: hypothetical protein [unclassified Ketobacter]MBI27813.1 hypothetical protein [Pseudomonadales bacterium]MCK5790685.1 hypothetical protein [Ketobacter sp.]MEC8812760.1 hypothetical protein [Pseudomonadota bacterium]HAU16328.1 hypothetical protein [Gammaproteobacteria bacterium]|tara:strand:- start:36561 stop:38690 length:2130 start_codon:yes stop_codon:yes gene_type:complete
MSFKKHAAAALGLATWVALGVLSASTLSACKSTTSSNVAMKMNVAGTDASVNSATTNSPTAGNFYTNGFPTDLRLNADGSIDIDDFPRRFHILTNTYVNGIRKYINIGGYHTVSPIYIPFTGAIDVTGLPQWGLDYATAESPIQVVDVDPGSPEYGRRFPLEVTMTEKADSYRPMDLLQIMPTLGVNLRPNTTYAAFVTDQVPLPAGNTIEQNGQLAGLLDPAQAEMPLPTRAIEVYAPLRDYMAQQGMAPASIIGATVWTTGDPTVKIRKGAEYAASLPIAPATEMTLLEEFPEYCVVQGFVEIPGFQRGITPYILSGGQVEWDENGNPIQQYTRNAEFVVTIPKTQPMPAAGFPMLFYHHGAGGNAEQVFTRGKYLRTAIDIVVPYKVLERGAGPSQIAAERGWASSGFGGHMSLDHLGLVLGFGMFGYNVFNPVALHNNYYQMVWERTYFRRFLNQLEVDPALCPAADTAGAPAFRINPDMQMLMGQSLGNWTSSLQLAADPDPFEGVLFTGMSGTWIKLFTDSAKFRLAMSAGVVNLLPGQELDEAHPFLMLMEWLMGGADVVPHMDTILRYPLKEAPHVLAISGINDGGSAEPTQRPHMLAVGVDLAGPDLGDTYDTTLFPHLEIGGATQLPYPVVNNVEVPGQGPRTAVVVRYENYVLPDRNGHHVTFDLEETKHQYGCFMEHLAQGRAPVVGEGWQQGGPCL